MRISVYGSRSEDRGRVQAALEGALTDSPTITMEGGPETGGTLNVTIFYKKDDTQDRFAVEDIITQTLQLSGVCVFCNVTHRDEWGVSTAEAEEPAYCGWPTL